VTFQALRGRPRAAALLAGGKLLDLQAAHRDRYGKLSPRLASAPAMAEAGEEAVELRGSRRSQSGRRGRARGRRHRHPAKSRREVMPLLRP